MNLTGFVYTPFEFSLSNPIPVFRCGFELILTGVVVGKCIVRLSCYESISLAFFRVSQENGLALLASGHLLLFFNELQIKKVLTKLFLYFSTTLIA